jgi:cytochrome c553
MPSRASYNFFIPFAVIVIGAIVLRLGAQEAAPPPATAPATTPVPATQQAGGISVHASSPIEAGKYLTLVGGCNDCHTPGWMESGGKGIAEDNMLTGLSVGFRGPWGTSYGPNLRIFANGFVENDFVKVLRERNSRPPMPWSALHAMSDQDLRSLYKYLKSLKPVGKPAPAFVPPGVEPKTPYFVLDPSVSAGAYGATTKPAATTAPAPVQP